MTAPVTLQCPTCASPLRAEDFRWDQSLATCGKCRAVISLPASPSDGVGPVPRALVPKPARVNIHQRMHGVEIRRRWFSNEVLLMIPFCIFWDGFLVAWYSRAFAADPSWLSILFPLGHLGVGIWLTYSTIAALFNTTRISLDRGELSVSHGPVPWLGGQTLDAAAIEQIYCKEKVSHRRRGTSCSHEVWMALRDGSQRRLLATGSDVEQALFIEQEMERLLGIKDRAVGGEINRS